MGNWSRRGILSLFAGASASGALAATGLAPPEPLLTPHFSGLPEPGEIPPRDIRPEIDLAVRAIENHLKAVPAGDTLFVPIGETHTLPSHAAFFAGVATALKQRGHSLAVGLELPYKTMIDEVLDAHPRDNATDEKTYMHAALRCDRDGALTLRALQQYSAAEAAHTRSRVYSSFREQGLSVRLNDLPDLTEGSVDDALDTNDMMYMKMHPQPPSNSAISATSPAGLKLRNDTLAENAIDHAADAKARIYLQSCGAAHLFGLPSERAKYEDSLVYDFESRGRAVLPIYLDNGSERETLDQRAEAWFTNQRAINIGRLPSREFSYSDLDRADRLELEKQEREYLRRMKVSLPEPGNAERAYRELTGIAKRPDQCKGESRLAERLFGFSP